MSSSLSRFLLLRSASAIHDLEWFVRICQETLWPPHSQTTSIQAASVAVLSCSARALCKEWTEAAGAATRRCFLRGLDGGLGGYRSRIGPQLRGGASAGGFFPLSELEILPAV
eukprot:1803828-Amphidinium_carterae.1